MLIQNLPCVHSFVAVSAIVGLLSAGTARGAVVVNSAKDVAPAGTPGDPYTPFAFTASDSDLAEGLTATVAYVNVDSSPGAGSTTLEGAAGEAAWTDGSLSTVYGGGDLSAYGTIQAHEGGSDPDEALITFDLGALYDLSQIDVYIGWVDSGRDDASFNVFVAGTDGVFGSSILSYTKPADDTGAFTSPVTNRHRIVDDGAANIANSVQFVRFEFTDSDNGYAGGLEFDIFGTPIPEPGTIALLTLGGFALLVRRRP